MQIDEARSYLAALARNTGVTDFDQEAVKDEGEDPDFGHIFRFERRGHAELQMQIQLRGDMILLAFYYKPATSVLCRHATAKIFGPDRGRRLEVQKESWIPAELLYGAALVYSGPEPDSVSVSGIYAGGNKKFERGEIHTILSSAPRLAGAISPAPDFMSYLVAAVIEWVMPRGHGGIVVPDAMQELEYASIKPFAPPEIAEMYLSAQTVAREAGANPRGLIGWNLAGLGLQAPAMVSAATMMNFALPRC